MTAGRGTSSGYTIVAWFLYSLTSTLLALCLSWALYAQVDYGYSFWYQQLGIAEHIQEYGPQNRFKSGFEQLPAEEHWRAFGQIVASVHGGGDGLAEILYQPPGEPSRALLHHDEIVHLQDVARLITLGSWALLLLALLWLPLAWWSLRSGSPDLRSRCLAASVPLLALALWLLIAGPTAVFYQLHIWIFPADNPWFFYWQDSLMSTLMKAPVLFAGIAVVLALGTMLLTPLLYQLGRFLARHAPLRR